MKLLINDANILIDIIKINLADSFLSLPFELKTTDFVFAELLPEQQKKLRSNKLHIIETETNDLADIYELNAKTDGVSFEDCSVWYYAQKLNGIMVTGDGTLRKKVKQNGIEVRGIIFLIEEMKKNGIINTSNAIAKLNELYKINPRLPKAEIDKRIAIWKSEL